MIGARAVQGAFHAGWPQAERGPGCTSADLPALRGLLPLGGAACSGDCIAVVVRPVVGREVRTEQVEQGIRR